jgi:hypothetical protein
MSEGSKFNFKTLLWIAIGLFFAVGIYYVLNATDIPSTGDGVH